MAKKLLIVESPAKAGTIQKYLGSDYQVVASMGHVRDLPTSKIGIDVDNAFTPSYIIPVKARPNLKKIKEALKGKEEVLLATDLDREGEAIAWHVSNALELDKSKIHYSRITFDEITKEAIKNAVAHPRDLNTALIDAQQARRVLDRLVGYSLSPLLWRKIYKGLSAGRVQSAALRLIVDREREREAFVPVEYWSLQAILSKLNNSESFKTNLFSINGKKIENQGLKNKQQVDQIVESLNEKAPEVANIEQKDTLRKPSAPYTTSTFQQDAVNKLGMSAKRAMRSAQKLYEAGHITYMRTDSVEFAESAVSSMRSYITKEFGKDYLPVKPNFYKSSNKKAQEAHEGIRPTDVSVLPSNVSKDTAEQKVYDMIRRRALASQMSPAKVKQTTVDVKIGEAIFRANGQQMVFPGYLSVWTYSDRGEVTLPELAIGEKLKLMELLPEQHYTEPPARYSEAALIKTLEEKGIGRPSTYAPIIDTLIQRKYVVSEQRHFVPEPIGKTVIDLLAENFEEIVDLGFTADMEEKLDQIAGGENTYVKVLEDFWKLFSLKIEKGMEKIEKIDTSEETDEKCPNCGSPMIIKMGRFGKFMACTKFPECKTTLPINKVEPTGLICPKCGKDLIWKKARRGSFIGCSGYPACDFALWKKEDLPKKIEELSKEGIELSFKQQAEEAFSKSS